MTGSYRESPRSEASNTANSQRTLTLQFLEFLDCSSTRSGSKDYLPETDGDWHLCRTEKDRGGSPNSLSSHAVDLLTLTGERLHRTTGHLLVQ